jgi:tRNA(Ile)-lysidine synthase
LAPSDRDAAIYALRILLAVVGGSRQLPDAERGAQLFDRLAAGPRGRATLSRCVADRRASGLYLYRELRDLPELMLSDAEAEWDVRFRIAGPAGSTVRAAGACEVTEDMAAGGVPLSLVRAALATQPLFCRSDGAMGEAPCWGAQGLTDARKTPSPSRPSGLTPLPHFVRSEDGRPVPILAPWTLFLPDFDLAPAGAVARLIGAEEPPAPPFTGHKHISA